MLFLLGSIGKIGKGCFIGCLTHSSEAKAVTDRFGLPEPFVLIAEHIFERLSDIDKTKGIEFFAAVPEAIENDGKDLSVIHWRFLKDIFENLPTVEPEIQKVIDPVIEGLQLLIDGKEWSNAALAARDARDAYTAARDARDAYTAARADHAARAAYDAARAAYDADAYTAALAADAADRAALAAARTTLADHINRACRPYRVEIERQRDLFLRLLKGKDVSDMTDRIKTRPLGNVSLTSTHKNAENDVFCHNKCGGGCRKSDYDFAIQEAERLLKIMGDNWTAEVHENLGWHITLLNGFVRLSPNYRHTLEKRWILSGYTCFFNAEKQFVIKDENPSVAVLKAYDEAKQFVKKLSDQINNWEF